MDAPSVRLSHIFTVRALARMLAPTYAAAGRVDEEEAHERLLSALGSREVLEGLLAGLAEATSRKVGPRSPADRVVDRLSAGVASRGGRVRAAETTPGVSAVLVRLDLELGLAGEPMRATLATPRGAAALRAGLGELGAFLVAELLRK